MRHNMNRSKDNFQELFYFFFSIAMSKTLVKTNLGSKGFISSYY